MLSQLKLIERVHARTLAQNKYMTHALNSATTVAYTTETHLNINIISVCLAFLFCSVSFQLHRRLAWLEKYFGETRHLKCAMSECHEHGRRESEYVHNFVASEFQ